MDKETSSSTRSRITLSELLNPEFLSPDVLKELLIERGHKFPNQNNSDTLTKEQLLDLYRSLILPKPQRIYSTKKRFERKLALNQVHAQKSNSKTVVMVEHNQKVKINGLKRPPLGQSGAETNDKNHEGISIPIKKPKMEITWP